MRDSRTTNSNAIRWLKSTIVNLRALLIRMGLDSLTLSIIIKGTIPPVLGVEIYQVDSLTKALGTLYTLVPIMALCCPYTMPRAQFLQTMGLNIIVTCIACAMSFLGLYACLQTRSDKEIESTTDKYNSSASVVCATFLFFNIYLVNALRATIPSFLYPSLCYSTFIGITFTNIHIYPTMRQGASLIWTMTINFFTGFAIALLGGLLVFPVSNRTIAFAQQARFIAALRLPEKIPIQGLKRERSPFPEHIMRGMRSTVPATAAIETFSNTAQLADLYEKFGMLYANESSAQQEFAWGNFDSTDVQNTNQLLREILIPSLGLATLEDMFHAVDKTKMTDGPGHSQNSDQIPNQNKVREEVLGSRNEALEVLSYVINEGLEHSGIILGLMRKPSHNSIQKPVQGHHEDVEASNLNHKPGDVQFVEVLKLKLSDFNDGRENRLVAFLNNRRRDMSGAAVNSTNVSFTILAKCRTLDQQQLYMALYIEHLRYCQGMAVLKLVQFADLKRDDDAANGKTWGVIVIMSLTIVVEYYFIIKYPRFVVAFSLLHKIGVTASEVNGQSYHPIYILAPYRLATAAAGSVVAFLWTVFPYPITDRAKLREDLGASMYVLAKYYSCVHSQIVARFQGIEGDPNVSTDLGNQLAKSERALFNEALALLQGLRVDSSFNKWELIIGGKFPHKSFSSIIEGTQSLLAHFSLMSHISHSLPQGSDVTWFRNLAKLLKGINPTSHDVISTLVLLSASVKNGNALPPYLRPPKYYDASDTLINTLSMAHISEPGYAAYAVLQVAITPVSADLEVLIAQVKKLVGEVEFRFDRDDAETIAWLS